MTLAGLWAQAWRLDRDYLQALAALSRALPGWGEFAATAVRNAPVALLLVWAVGALTLAPEDDEGRAASLRAMAAATVLALAWVVAWPLVPIVAPASRFAFAPAALSQALTSGLPLGGAALVLGMGARGPWPWGALRVAIAWAYWLARVAIGADGPLEAVAEAASAVAALALIANSAGLRAYLDACAGVWSRVLGLSAA